MTRIAINGFGRIGRNTFKAGLGKPGFQVVAINDLTDTNTLAHLLKHDTTYRTYHKTVSYNEKHLIVDGKKIPVFAERDPGALPWKKLKVDVVLECTGIFTSEEKAMPHIAAGAKRVIISAPSKGGYVPTQVIGVTKGAPKDAKILNNASCTTNSVAPVTAVMDEAFGVRKAFMTTIHSYTADQNLQDGPHRDLRRARAAAQNIVPTTTGAAIATTEAIPSLKNKFDGISIRVPTITVSLSDFTFLLKKKVTVDLVKNAFTKAAASPRWKGILEVTDEPLVSSDFIGSSASAVVDLPFTYVIDGDFVKVLAWYDNEWGYSHRLAELAMQVMKSYR
ncbi:type I glyceraldehyde-3-phosphate dehydrogenase [Patescibacteria group bacterium]|uniref:Type I glyceraldehyde-3-phosphate dehydrogenase n=1 Tax=candidate division WWE3 bacterium TaxID=2053526 RepID=A0A928Y4Z6_UNCKA|nr:type I glyceraldehyde-3-phosphate dehydrogenase [candidate division WWE3 bacterium]MCL4732360.1 type I glyceraldehyde-3-phosphate dehydrogenase [Patescibacteria group bacterium]MDL1952785.1 type I glyceraldehyde-3-phosphate dehydrogenase [Candidatus Uhrbacteria bacterium UHB]RIL01021.1 MAG: type I glyceraldehyde-3-phosphate dehydrogenase [Candidatus Uhrbacteria bacterium]